MHGGAGFEAAWHTQIQFAGQVGIRHIAIDVQLFHLFEVGNGKEAAIGQGGAGRSAASLPHFIDHGQKRAVIVGVLRHPLGLDQVIVRDRDLARVATRSEDEKVSARVPYRLR
jgi:hypothetical protein